MYTLNLFSNQFEEATANYPPQPFLKWPGGKRQIIKEIKRFIPSDIDTYYEPFVGGGAVLFEVQPKKAVINDYNYELINVYKAIKNNLEELIEQLKTYENTEECFYRVRAMDRSENFSTLSAVVRAARTIFLNKTCYNGLFRVNSKGYFNAPFGRYKNPKFINKFQLKAVSEYLNSNEITILNLDFAESLKSLNANDFVYFDPPYDPVSEIASFTEYTSKGFNKSEQIRLKETCDLLNSNGVKFLLSNSATKFIKDLYKEYTIEIVYANRSINSNGKKRGKIEEILVMNF